MWALIFDRHESNSAEEGRPFQQTVLEQLDVHGQNHPMSLGLNLTPYTKISSKQVTIFSVQYIAVQLFKKWENLRDMGLYDEFLDSATKAWPIKQSFCQRTCWEDERTSYRLEENIYEFHIWQWTRTQNKHKGHSKLNSRNQTNPNRLEFHVYALLEMTKIVEGENLSGCHRFGTRGGAGWEGGRFGSKRATWEFPGRLAVKDLVVSLQWLWSLLWHRFHPWPGNFRTLEARPKHIKRGSKSLKIRNMLIKLTEISCLTDQIYTNSKVQQTFCWSRFEGRGRSRISRIGMQPDTSFQEGAVAMPKETTYAFTFRHTNFTSRNRPWRYTSHKRKYTSLGWSSQPCW